MGPITGKEDFFEDQYTEKFRATIRFRGLF